MKKPLQGYNCRESINMQLDKKLNPSHPTVFVSVFLIEDVIQQPETWEENIHQGKPSGAHDQSMVMKRSHEILDIGMAYV